MSCLKGTTKGQKLTPTLVLLLLNLFPQLPEEEAKPQGAGKKGHSLLGYVEKGHYWGNFPHLRPQPRALLAGPGLSCGNQHPAG